MAELKLEIRLRRPRAVCGEGLPVDLVLRNEGNEAVRVAIGSSSPIVFALRADSEGPILYTRSRETALLEAIGDRSKMLPPDIVNVIAGGGSLSLSEDAAAGSAVPIAAGHYILNASWRSIDRELSSNAIEVVVDAPMIDRLTSVYCAQSGSHAQAFDSRARGAGGEGAGIYQRETDSVRADAQVFRHRAQSDRVEALVLAVHLEPRLERRWIGWLQGRELAGLIGPGPGTPAAPLTAQVDLDAPVLVEPALQRAQGPDVASSGWDEGVFHVVGLREGASHVQRFVATRAAITPGKTTPLGAPAGARVLTQVSVPEAWMRFVWAETSGGLTRVFARPYSLELEPRSERPVLLYERSAPLLALEMEPIELGEAPGHVHALFAPEEQGPLRQQLAYVRIPLVAGADQPREYAIGAPRPTVDAYAISGSTAGGLMVLAKAGSELCAVAAAGSAPWRTLLTDVPGLRHLRLAATPEGYWAALGADPSRGVICVPDPDFSRER
jgi:hypothetical protein